MLDTKNASVRLLKQHLQHCSKNRRSAASQSDPPASLYLSSLASVFQQSNQSRLPPTSMALYVSGMSFLFMPIKSAAVFGKPPNWPQDPCWRQIVFPVHLYLQTATHPSKWHCLSSQNMLRALKWVLIEECVTLESYRQYKQIHHQWASINKFCFSVYLSHSFSSLVSHNLNKKDRCSERP